MRFYRLDWQDPAVASCVSWHGSERDAVQARMGLVKEGVIRRRQDARIAIVEVPTRKEDLLIWLNANIRRDNG